MLLSPQVLKSAPQARNSPAATRPLHATGSTGSTLSPKASSTGIRSNVSSRASSTRPAAAAGPRPTAATAVSKAQPAAAAPAAPQQQQQQAQAQAQPDPNLLNELNMQRELIAKLHAQLEARDGKIKELESAVVQPAAQGGTGVLDSTAAAQQLAAELDAMAVAGSDLHEGDQQAEPSSSGAAAGSGDPTGELDAQETEAAAAAPAPSGLGSRNVSISSKDRPTSAAASRRTSAGQQRELSHAGSGASRTGGSSSNSRGGPSSRPQSGKPKVSAAAAALAAGGPAPWQADEEEPVA
jgi:hypothetical protein